MSIATIGVTWLRHTVITLHTSGIDTQFVRINLLLLLLPIGLLSGPRRGGAARDP